MPTFEDVHPFMTRNKNYIIIFIIFILVKSKLLICFIDISLLSFRRIRVNIGTNMKKINMHNNPERSFKDMVRYIDKSIDSLIDKYIARH